jgi:hypothetical protein
MSVLATHVDPFIENAVRRLCRSRFYCSYVTGAALLLSYFFAGAKKQGTPSRSPVHIVYMGVFAFRFFYDPMEGQE